LAVAAVVVEMEELEALEEQVALVVDLPEFQIRIQTLELLLVQQTQVVEPVAED
jgi:uncharacterized protein YbaP (TraB family)